METVDRCSSESSSGSVILVHTSTARRLTECFRFPIYRIPMPEALPDSVHDEQHPLSPTPLSPKPVHAVNPKDDREWIREIKLEFEKSADPWGRIVVYHFELLEAE